MRSISAMGALLAFGGAYDHRFTAPFIPRDGRKHFTTEQPLTKRQRRRLRGKGAE